MVDIVGEGYCDLCRLSQNFGVGLCKKCGGPLQLLEARLKPQYIDIQVGVYDFHDNYRPAEVVFEQLLNRKTPRFYVIIHGWGKTNGFSRSKKEVRQYLESHSTLYNWVAGEHFDARRDFPWGRVRSFFEYEGNAGVTLVDLQPNLDLDLESMQ